MKKESILTGYILTAGERTAHKYIAPFGMVIMTVFVCILWAEAFKNSGSVIHYLFVFCLSAFVIFLVVGYFQMRSIDELQFCIESETVSNFSKKNRISLCLSQNLFITMLTRDLAYGKAIVTMNFYLFSSRPFVSQDVCGQGLSTLKRLNERGIIIIPQSQSTEEWVMGELHLAKVPDYPVVSCLCGGDKGGKGTVCVNPNKK